jgi:hypothetical protein
MARYQMYGVEKIAAMRHFISLLSNGADLGFVKAPLPDSAPVNATDLDHCRKTPGRWLEWKRPSMRSFAVWPCPPIVRVREGTSPRRLY